MKIKILLLVVIIATSSILHGQTDFRTGYIIQNNGDTTYGEIDYRGDFLMSKTCKFKNPGNIVTEYSPYDINAFRFIGGKYYKSKEVNNTKIFLEFLIKGKINIYYAWFERKEHYFLEKDSLQLVEIPYEEVVKEIDNRRYLKQSTQHVGFLTYYMQDAPSIQSSIQKLDKPEHVGLIKLAEEYHNAVCKDEKCVIYEKKPPFFKVNVETVAGMVKYMDDEVLKDKYYFQGGVMAHLWLLRTNEKIYL
ncbi:MAG: hypothetical protein MI922_20250, partial [Bacteroidales bacterium]|nr:hypothetical protein [Bacteroidales bacterium]